MILFTIRRDNDGTWFALVLLPHCSQTIEIAGSYDQEELKASVWEAYKDAKYVSSRQFEEEFSSRQRHSPEMLALLQKYGESLEKDIASYVVYGSAGRYVDNTWCRISDAVFIHVDKKSTGYYTYVAVSYPLEKELQSRYELSFVSSPYGQEETI